MTTLADLRPDQTEESFARHNSIKQQLFLPDSGAEHNHQRCFTPLCWEPCRCRPLTIKQQRRAGTLSCVLADRYRRVVPSSVFLHTEGTTAADMMHTLVWPVQFVCSSQAPSRV